MASIAIVTDTSSDLLPEQAAEAGIRLVPLSVSFGDETFEAVTELSNEDFYQRLTAPGAPLPRTAAPNPQQFEAAYQEALDGGADGVVCVTLSQELSATYSSAVQGAGGLRAGHASRSSTHAPSPTPWRSSSTEAAALAREGATLAEVVARARDLAGRVALFFTVDTLEYLQNGGRIGRASALLGTMLSIKPILVRRGRRRGHGRQAAHGRQGARATPGAGQPSDRVERATVLHTVTPGIEAFRDEIAAARRPRCGGRADIGLVGPVAGTHVGPGMYGVSLITPA